MDCAGTSVAPAIPMRQPVVTTVTVSVRPEAR